MAIQITTEGPEEGDVIAGTRRDNQDKWLT